MADEAASPLRAAQPTETPAPNGDATGNTADNAGKTFTQAEVDALVKERLAREQRSATARAEPPSGNRQRHLA